MTIEKLLECDAATLEAMSDTQLKEHFAPFFNVTRPELAVDVKIKAAQNLATSHKPAVAEAVKKMDSKNVQAMLELMKNAGLDPTKILGMKKKG